MDGRAKDPGLKVVDPLAKAGSSKPTARRILFVVNDAPFFLSHRLPLAVGARNSGYEVHVATPSHPDAGIIKGNGFAFHAIPLTRKGLAIWQELAGIRALFRLYKELRPDIVHHVTIKPVLYGGIAARLAGVPAVVSAVSGLGYIFLRRGVVASLVRFGVRQMYRAALRHRCLRVIFQNPEDQTLFEQQSVIAPGKAVLIRGSGVDISQFIPRPEPPGPPLVLLASRMLRDKGVMEFVEAARQLRSEGVEARFALVGDSDPDNPATIPTARLESWQDAGHIEWWGKREDMPSVFAQSHVVCLPSYREGLPKVLIEAAACGRPIVTTDVPGCREVVENGENGLLVPPRNSAALATAMRTLIGNPEMRKAMGRRSREVAEREFTVEEVVRRTLAVYRTLLEECAEPLQT